MDYDMVADVEVETDHQLKGRADDDANHTDGDVDDDDDEFGDATGDSFTDEGYDDGDEDRDASIVGEGSEDADVDGSAPGVPSSQ